MNRMHLFLLFVVFLLIPLSAPAFSGLMPAAQPGCDGVAERVSTTELSCSSSALLAADNLPVVSAVVSPDDSAGKASNRPVVQPLRLQEFMQHEQAESREQWFLLVIITVVVLVAVRSAPSMK